MTTLGHALTGLSIGVLCMPRRWRRTGKAALLAAFVVLADVPDIKFFARYEVRHSIFVNLAMMAVPVALLAAWKGLRQRIGGWAVVAAGAAAWLSHLPLDSLYNHGRGVPVVWPVSSFHLNLAIPWFRALRGWYAADWYTARILLIEALCYGAILGLCLLGRRVFLARGGRTECEPLRA